MLKYIVCCGMALWLVHGTARSRGGEIELSLGQSMERLREKNLSLQIADRAIDWARGEHRRVSSFWYPSVSVTGAYLHMANRIEVEQPLSQFTDPAKDFIHSILPDDQIISGLLDHVGTYTLRFPLAPQDVATIDANVTWPVFAGGKRIYAGRIGRTMVEVAEVNRAQVGARMQTLLVESYFGLRLGMSVVEVREQTLRALERHYRDALKLEASGMINKADRLFVEVSMDEARRALETARKDLDVAQSALKALIRIDSAVDVRPVSPLFINDTLPPVAYFKGEVGDNNYVVNQLKLQDDIADNQLRIGRAGYVPTIALMGKQTLYSNGIQKNLIPRTFVGVGFTWNLFDGLDREQKIRQAKITKQTVGITRDKAIDDISVGIDKFYSQMQNALSSVNALNTTIELSRELVRMRKKAFTEGMATSTEVVDAEVMLSKVEIASLLAFYQYDVALINLLSACGIPDTFRNYSETGRSEHFVFAP